LFVIAQSGSPQARAILVRIARETAIPETAAQRRSNTWADLAGCEEEFAAALRVAVEGGVEGGVLHEI